MMAFNSNSILADDEVELKILKKVKSIEKIVKKGCKKSVPKTGQTTCYDETGTVIPCAGTGQDGDLQIGRQWPEPRFTDIGDGTVKDNLTGLVWLQDTNCIDTHYSGFDNDDTVADGQVFWQHALDFVTGINDGTYPNCGAGFTDWRLPNIREIVSLADYGNHGPALPNGHPFVNVGLDAEGYWTSTTVHNHAYGAWWTACGIWATRNGNKTTETHHTWPVRSGK